MEPFARILWQIDQLTSSQERVERALANMERDSAFMKAVLQKCPGSDNSLNMPLQPPRFKEDVVTTCDLQWMTRKRTVTAVPLGLSASWPSDLKLRRVLESVQGLDTELSVGNDFERLSGSFPGRVSRRSGTSSQRTDSTFSIATSNHSTWQRVMAMRRHSAWSCTIDVISAVFLITDTVVQP